MMKRTILHIDMDNFYASVECLLNPELRDRAVIVCGDEKKRHGVVLAKNMLAKKMGVKTGEALLYARKKCPDAVCVQANMDHYVRFSVMAQNIYARYTNQIEPFGLDLSIVK